MTLEKEYIAVFRSSILQKVEFDDVVYSLYENRIFHVCFPKMKRVTMEHIEVGNKFMERYGDGRYYNIFELSSFVDVDPEVRSWAADSEGNSYTHTDAIIIESLPQKIISDFYLKFNKPIRPTKVFYSLEKAANWTFEQMKKYGK